MSANLYWRPADTKQNSLPDALRMTLRDKRGFSGGEMRLTEADTQYFQGLCDAGVHGAQDVMDAIGDHGSIVLWLEY